jgi:hypothetical protein
LPLASLDVPLSKATEALGIRIFGGQPQ